MKRFITLSILAILSSSAFAGRPAPATSSAQQQPLYQPTANDSLSSCEGLYSEDVREVMVLRTNIIAAQRRITELQTQLADATKKPAK